MSLALLSVHNILLFERHSRNSDIKIRISSLMQWINEGCIIYTDSCSNKIMYVAFLLSNSHLILFVVVNHECDNLVSQIPNV